MEIYRWMSLPHGALSHQHAAFDHAGLPDLPRVAAQPPPLSQALAQRSTGPELCRLKGA
jgi:hypothetical protein